MKKCNYCGLEKNNLTKIGNNYICDDCKEIVNNDREIVVNKVLNKDKEGIKPWKIKETLDKYIVKQEDAKIALATEIYSHLKRSSNEELRDTEKNNILILGPSGCGKTYLVSTIAKTLNIPMITVNATEFTANGYVGKSVDSIGKWMLQAADGDIDKAERGIVYIDEIDKIACRKANDNLSNGNKDVGGLEVQKELLKIIEGTDLRLEDEVSLFEEPEEIINTRNMLFIFSGAFEGLDKIAELDKEISISIINNKESKDTFKDLLLSEQLINYGFLKEFIGRIPIITKIEKLNEEDIIEIMTKKENNIISQYKKIFAAEDIKLKFATDAIKYFAHIAYKSNLGARGLKSIIGNVMNKLMYQASSSNVASVTVNKALIDKLLGRNENKSI